jgi:hypothetical protein
MPRCLKCGGHAEKVHRTGWEKLFFSDAYRCQQCKRRTRRLAGAWWVSTYWFLSSRYSVCVRCGTQNVERVEKPDRLNDISKHPLSLIQQLFFAPRKSCSYCRLQYSDVRPLAPLRHARTKGVHGPSV